MISNRVRAAAFVSVGALVLSACGSDDDSVTDGTDEPTATAEQEAPPAAAPDTTAPAAGAGADLSVFEGTTVGIVSLAPGLEPVDRIQGGVEECVTANGGEIQVFDAKGGAEAVLAFEQANGAGVDAIYNVANDVSGGGLDAALAAAAAEGRPVVTAWGGQRSGTYSITGLEFQSAARVGQYVIDRLTAQNDGVAAGKVLVVNARVTPSLRQRADAFVAMVGPDTEFPDISTEVIEIDIANALADSQAKVEQAIQADPEIDAVYASFDTIGQGAAAAIDAAGGPQFVVSFNGDSSALDLIRSGSSFAATAANDLEGTATIACDLFAQLLAGDTPSATTYWMDSPLVTAQNVPATGFASGAGAFQLYQP
jgi:simple sugar transport system substrate-binding protein